MPMTKAEKAYLEQIERELRLHKSMFITAVCGPDLPVPTSGMTRGWVMNAHRRDVAPALSKVASHAIGIDGKPPKETSSQRSISMYSTRLLALQDLRAALSREFATELAKVDDAIERERASTHPESSHDQ